MKKNGVNECTKNNGCMNGVKVEKRKERMKKNLESRE